VILPFSCPIQFSYTESLPVYLGRSLDLLWVVLGQLRLRSFLVLACTCSQSLQFPQANCRNLNPYTCHLGVVSPSFLCLCSPWLSTLFLSLPLLISLSPVSVLCPDTGGVKVAANKGSFVLGRRRGTADTTEVLEECSLRLVPARGCSSLRLVMHFSRGVSLRFMKPLAELIHSDSQGDMGSSTWPLTA